MIRDPDGKEKKILLSFEHIKGKNIVEIGCGKGHFTKILVNGAKSLVCLDTNPSLISKAREEFPRERFKQIEFFIASVNDLSVYSDESFDMVVFSYSFHETGDLHGSLKEAYRLIKKGGSIIIYEPKHSGQLCQFLISITERFSEEKELNEAQEIIKNFKCGSKISREVTIKWQYDNKQDLIKETLALASKFSDLDFDKLRAVIDQKTKDTPPEEEYTLIDEVIIWQIIK